MTGVTRFSSFLSFQKLQRVFWAVGVFFGLLLLQTLNAQSASACAITFTNPLAGDFTSGTYTVTWTDDGAGDCTNIVNIRYNSPSNDGASQILIGAIAANNGGTGITFNTTALHSGDAKEDALDYSITGDLGGPSIGSVGTFAIDNNDPVISAAETADSDLDGVVDQIIVTIDDGVGGSGMDACTTTGWTVTDNDGVVTPISVDACTVDSLTQLTLDVTPTTPTDFLSDSTPEVDYVQGANGNVDRAGNELATGNIANATDGAAPAPISADFQDTDEDGTVDLVSVLLSEAFGTYTHDNGDWTFSNNADLNLVVTGINASAGSTIDLDVSADADETSVTTTPTISFTATTGVLDDGTNAQAGPTTDVDVDDLAPASIISARSVSLTEIEVTFSEDIDTAQLDPGGADFTVVDGGDLTDPTITAADNGAGTINMTTLTINGPIALAFAFYPANTVAYSGAGVVEDLLANFNALTPAVPIDDGIAATVVSVETNDSTGNGKIDEIIVVFTEPVTDAGTYMVGADTTPFLQVTGYDVIFLAGNGTDTLTYTLTEIAGTCDATDQTGCDTDATPALTFDALNAQDGGGNDVDLTGAPANADDGADPAPIGFTYTASVPSSGNVDEINLILSEDVTYAALDGTDYVIANNDLTGLDGDAQPNAATDPLGAGDTITYTVDGTTNLTGVCTTNGEIEPTLAYTNDTANTVVDAAGNELQTFGATTVLDFTRPVLNLLSTTAGTPAAHPIFGTTANSVTDTIEIQFTECLAAGQTDTTGFTVQNNDNSAAVAFTLSIDNTGDPLGEVILDLDNDDANNWTGRFNYGYDELTGTIVDDSAQGNEIVNQATLPAVNSIPPVVYDLQYRSSGANGSVDRLFVFLSETVTDGAALGDWAITPNDLIAFDDDGTPEAKSLLMTNFTNDTIQLDTTGTTDLTGVTGGTEPDVTYTAGGNYSDTDTVSLASFGPSSITDDADPVIIDNVSLDTSVPLDGITDTIEFQASEGVEDADFTAAALADWLMTDALANSEAFDTFSTAVNVLAVDATANDDFFALSIAAPATVTGTGIVSYTYTNDGGDDITDDNANLLQDIAITAANDGALPVLMAFAATPGSPNPPNPAGIGDNLMFDLTFSEDMDTAIQLDCSFDDGSGPYGTVDDATGGHTNGFVDADNTMWEGDYDTNPIVAGTPPSGTHTFACAATFGQDPQGNVYNGDVEASVDLTFLIDSETPDSDALTISPNPAEESEPVFTITAEITDNLGVASAAWFIAESDGNVLATGPMMFSTPSVAGDLEVVMYDEIDLSGIVFPSVTNDYKIYVLGTDIGGNVEVKDASNTETFTVEGDSDVTPPVISNIVATPAQTTAAITWDTDEDATAQVEYGLTDSYGNVTAEDTTTAAGGHSVTVTGLTCNTLYHFRVLSEDASGNEATSADDTFTTTACTVDSTPPAGTVTTGAATVNADDYVISGTLAADADDVTVTINNGSADVGTTVVTAGSTVWSVIVPLPQNAATTFTANAEDESGNAAAIGSVVITEDSTLGVDSTAPTGTVTTGAATVDADFYTIEGTLGADADGVVVTVNDGSGDVGTTIVAAGNTSWSIVVPLPQDAATTFTATATDPSTNATVLGNVIITEDSTGDVTPPAGTVTTGAATVNSDFYTISGTLTADADDVTVTIDDGSGDVGTTVVLAGGTAWSVVVSLPQDAATTFTATAVDGSANSAAIGSVVITEDSSLGVDTTPPNGTVDTLAATVDADFYTIEGTVFVEPEEIAITLNNGSRDVGTTIINAGNANWSVVVPLPQDAATTFTARAVDESGNGFNIGSIIITEDSTPGDTTKPTLVSTSPSTEQIDGAVADVVFTFNDDTGFDATAANNLVNFTLDGADISASGNTSVTVGGGGADPLVVTYSDANMGVGVHNFNLEVMDAAGNTREVAATVDVVDGTDTTAPIATVSIINVTTTAADIFIYVDEDADYEVDIDDDPTFATPDASPYTGGTAAGPFTVNATGLTANTQYYMRVRVRDADLNERTSIHVFTTNEADAPILTDILATPSTTNPSTDATITWNTNEDSDNNGEPDNALNTATNAVEYGTNTDLETNSTTVATTTGDGVDAHSAALTGLTPNTLYYYRVKSTANGKTSYSQIFQFRTSSDDTAIIVHGIDTLKNSGTAGGNYETGWHFRFNMTANNLAETGLNVRLSDWSNTVTTLAILNNTLYCVSANGVSHTLEADITANCTNAIENNYTGTDSDISTIDNDPVTAGRQFYIDVYYKIPAGAAGTYTSTYGIRTQ